MPTRRQLSQGLKGNSTSFSKMKEDSPIHKKFKREASPKREEEYRPQEYKFFDTKKVMNDLFLKKMQD